MVALLVITSVAAALVPVERRTRDSSSSTQTTPPTVEQTSPSGTLHRETLRASAKKPQKITIRLGDQLELRVTSSKATDQVAIPSLGELEDVEPDAAAHFDLLPFEPGRYAVDLVEAERPVGFIVVRPRRGDQNESSIAPPGSSTAALTSGALRAS
jgi:hypothetical protein